MSTVGTIAAIATPPGRGGIGVVRVSGPAVAHIATGILGALPPRRRAVLRAFKDAAGETLDTGLALFFPAPHSFTGEDVLELHGHGGPIVLQLVLTRLLELGARVAEPGEFSRRAFLNDKLDLAQAEAIADLIDSGSEQAARAAVRSLQGQFSLAVQRLTDALIETRLHVEAAIDFPEEEIDFLNDAALRTRFERCLSLCADIRLRARNGVMLRDGMTVVIAGRPNAGKSSLLNRLAGYDAAIVTDIPGTTRDVLREHIHIDGMPLHIVDTAGLRADADPVEAEGIRRAQREITQADRVLYVIDASLRPSDRDVQQALDELSTAVPVILIFNKIDCLNIAPQFIHADPARIYLSAATGAGVDLLREHLKLCMGYQSSEATLLSARQRHLDALRRASEHLDQAQRALQTRAGELMAEELRQAQHALGEITGEFTADDLLGRIFASFCIGK